MLSSSCVPQMGGACSALHQIGGACCCGRMRQKEPCQHLYVGPCQASLSRSKERHHLCTFKLLPHWKAASLHIHGAPAHRMLKVIERNALASCPSGAVASCTMASHHLERCAHLRQWRLSHAGELPRRKSDNQEEASLAMWLSKALPRRFRSLGDGPSKKQLTPEETLHLDSILQEKLHADVDNPATDSGSHQPPAPKPPLTSGDLRAAARPLKRARKDEALPKDSDMRATPSSNQAEVRKLGKPRTDPKTTEASQTTETVRETLHKSSDHCVELPIRLTRIADDKAEDTRGLQKFDLEHAFAETHVRLKNLNNAQRMMMRVIDHAWSSTSCISHRVADMMRTLDWHVTTDFSDHQAMDACGSVQLMLAINAASTVVQGLANRSEGFGGRAGRPCR